MPDDDVSAHRTRSNMRRPTPHPETIREIDQVMEDAAADQPPTG